MPSQPSEAICLVSLRGPGPTPSLWESSSSISGVSMFS
jgi:hypothetical protein